MMRDAKTLDKGIKFLIFPSTISLRSHNFLIKHAFNKLLEIMEPLKDFRFMAQQIDPCEFAIVINETNIKVILANKSGSRSPHIRKD